MKTKKILLKEIGLLTEKCLQIDGRLDELAEQSRRLTPNADEISEWIETLPIASLYDLCNHARGGEIKLRLQDLHTKTKLRKEFEQKEDEADQITSTTTIAKIDLILLQIKRVK